MSVLECDGDSDGVPDDGDDSVHDINRSNDNMVVLVMEQWIYNVMVMDGM